MFKRVNFFGWSVLAMMFAMFCIVPHMAEAVNYGVGNGPRSVAIGDLNGDNDMDLTVANRYGGDVSVLLGNGDSWEKRIPSIISLSESK